MFFVDFLHVNKSSSQKKKKKIKLKKSYNRQKRNENNEVRKKVLGNLYNEQKKGVQFLIHEF